MSSPPLQCAQQLLSASECFDRPACIGMVYLVCWCSYFHSYGIRFVSENVFHFDTLIEKLIHTAIVGRLKCAIQFFREKSMSPPISFEWMPWSPERLGLWEHDCCWLKSIATFSQLILLVKFIVFRLCQRAVQWSLKWLCNPAHHCVV